VAVRACVRIRAVSKHGFGGSARERKLNRARRCLLQFQASARSASGRLLSIVLDGGLTPAGPATSDPKESVANRMGGVAGEPYEKFSLLRHARKVKGRKGCRAIGQIRVVPRDAVSARFNALMFDTFDHAYGLCISMRVSVLLPASLPQHLRRRSARLQSVRYGSDLYAPWPAYGRKASSRQAVRQLQPRPLLRPARAPVAPTPHRQSQRSLCVPVALETQCGPAQFSSCHRAVLRPLWPAHRL